MQGPSTRPDWDISLSSLRTGTITQGNHTFTSVDDFLCAPDAVLNAASLQKFAKLTPQYPGVRAPLASDVCEAWLEALSPHLDASFVAPPLGWRIEAWFSIVTTPPQQLIPMQRFPHVDGTDPNQIAMMLYLDQAHDQEAEHGGTGFYRHISSGLESLTRTNFPAYRAALEADVRRAGLPPPGYTTDGAPFFERIHASKGRFNQAIFYRGNLLHSGIIGPDQALSPDPLKGRLTINAFFRPIHEDKAAS